MSRFKHFRPAKQLWFTVLYIPIVAHTVYTIRKWSKSTELCGRQRQWGVLPSGKMSVIYFIMGWLIQLVFKKRRKEKSVFFPSVKISVLTFSRSIKEMTFQLLSVFYSALLAKGYYEWKNWSLPDKAGTETSWCYKKPLFSGLLLFLILRCCFKGNQSQSKYWHSNVLMSTHPAYLQPKTFVKLRWTVDQWNVFH